MDVYCDLHIHSCLSPCAEDEMTPWNLVGMARVKGLDVIALTDHNTARNVPDAMAAGAEYGVAVIPGMEITSREEAHILGYFSNAAQALAAGEEVYAHLPQVLNQPALFGNQIIMSGDVPSGALDKLLINSTDLSVEQVCALIRTHGGIAVPAHINRGSSGMIGALGLMPLLPEYPIVEVCAGVDCPAYAVKGRFVLHSSDAHRLEAIQERVFALDCARADAAALMAVLQKKGT